MPPLPTAEPSEEERLRDWRGEGPHDTLKRRAPRAFELFTRIVKVKRIPYREAVEQARALVRYVDTHGPTGVTNILQEIMDSIADIDRPFRWLAKVIKNAENPSSEKRVAAPPKVRLAPLSQDMLDRLVNQTATEDEILAERRRLGQEMYGNVDA